MDKYPANKDQEEFVEHFETLLKEDGYQGPYVVVQKEKSHTFLKALISTVKTGNYRTEWAAIEITKKSIYQQVLDYVFD
jgi:hypothetical protein